MYILLIPLYYEELSSSVVIFLNLKINILRYVHPSGYTVNLDPTIITVLSVRVCKDIV